MANDKKRIYAEQHWNLHKFSTLPAEIHEELEWAWDEFSQYMNAAMADVDDSINREIPFASGMENSRSNLEMAFDAFDQMKDQIRQYHEYALQQGRTDIEKFVDGEPVNVKPTKVKL